VLSNWIFDGIDISKVSYSQMRSNRLSFDFYLAWPFHSGCVSPKW
jgi:hypothetical protein